MAEKSLKEYIVSFRIPKEQAAIVDKLLDESPIIGVKSPNQFFRKIGLDFLAGKITYKNPSDVLLDSGMEN